MTEPQNQDTVGADEQGVPQLGRILSPEEFQRAKAMSPEQVADSDIGVGDPPVAKKKAAAPRISAPWEADTTTIQKIAQSGTREDSDAVGRGGQKSGEDWLKDPGIGGVIARQIVKPIADHPLEAGMIAGAQFLPFIGPLVNIAMTGAMGIDVAKYLGTVAAERQLPPDIRALAEKDPERISGEQAAVEALMLGALPLLHAGVKKVKGMQAEAATNATRTTDGGQGIDAPNSVRVPVTGTEPTGRASERTPNESGLATSAEQDRAALRKAQREQVLALRAQQQQLGARVKAHAERAADAVQSMLAPATRGPQAIAAAGIIRANAGQGARSFEQSAYELGKFRDMVDPMSDGDRLAMIDHMEGGDTPLDPNFTPVTDALRSHIDAWWQKIGTLPGRQDQSFIENYFPHFWDNPDVARSVAAQAANGDPLAMTQGTVAGKRPFEGPASFNKQRSIMSTKEGMEEHGLVPVTTNPIDLALLKIREMQRFYTAHTSMAELKDQGLATFVRAGERPPEGHVRINDKIGTVYGPHEGAVSLPDDANLAPEDVRVFGQRIMGNYYAPEPAARVINNYLSPGLKGNPFYDIFRGVGSVMNQAQLGLSAFHLGMTSIDATVSRLAVGLEYLDRGLQTGDFSLLAKAGEKALMSPLSPFPGIIQGTVGDLSNHLFGSNIQLGMGARIRDAYRNPNSTASAHYQALANAYAEAGGRIGQDPMYQNSAPQRMLDAWNTGHPLKAAAWSPLAVVEAAAKPLMEHIVPLQKMQVFGEMAEKVMRELPLDASPAQIRAALQPVASSVDNRMGQLVYDNLFWHKAFKDVLMASIRSVGWNTGTVSEVGGGIKDVAKNLAAVSEKYLSPTGETPATADLTMSHKATYVTSLAITAAMYGATYQYLRTGEAPADMKDLYYPRTGEYDTDGNPVRAMLPTYIKDVGSVKDHPIQTVLNKLSPIVQTFTQMAMNRDFYGDKITHWTNPLPLGMEKDADVNALRHWAKEVGMYVGRQVLPFSVTNADQFAAQGDTTQGSKVGSYLGVTPAHREDERGPAQRYMMGEAADKGVPALTHEKRAVADTKKGILDAALRGDRAQVIALAKDAIEKGVITQEDYDQLAERFNKTPAQERFLHLDQDKAEIAVKLSDPQELALFKDAVETAMAKKSTPKRQALLAAIQNEIAYRSGNRTRPGATP